MSKRTIRSSERAPEETPSAQDTQATADAATAEAESGTADGDEAARSGKESPAGEGAGIPRQQSAAEAADSETGESART